jgi:inosine-uridine nucleoside N-ribohydrolase
MKWLCPALSLLLLPAPAAAVRPVIILDTDMGSDVDDAGALAVLHELAALGEVTIAGVIYSSGRNKYGVGVCDAINTWYGRGDLPLGQYKRSDVGDPRNRYSEQVAKATEKYGHDVVDEAPDLVAAYRSILRAQADRTVTIVTIGHPHGLAYLLRDAKTEALVRKKVTRWVAMAYSGETPQLDWNTGRNGAGAYFREVFPRWPTDLYVSSAGKTILTGHRSLHSTPGGNPVREAFRLWGALQNGSESWDQIAVLFAVRPEYFEIDSRGSLNQTAEGKTFWDPSRDNPKHHRVRPRLSDEQLEAIMEDLMSRSPRNRPQGIR